MPVGSAGLNTAPPRLFLQSPQIQGSQLSPTSLDSLVSTLSEPALLHHDGRIVALNAHLAAILGHPAPHLLVGLPVDALLDGAEPLRPGVASRASLRTPDGSLPVLISRMAMAMHDGQGTLWVISPSAPDVPESGAAWAIASLEALCEDLWDWPEDRPLDRRALLQRVDAALDHLRPSDEDYAELAELVVSVAGDRDGCTLDIREEAPVGAPEVEVVELLEMICAALTGPATLTVQLDVTGHPIVVVRTAEGPVLSDASVQQIRRRLSALRGSIVVLEEDRVARVRLPSA